MNYLSYLLKRGGAALGEKTKIFISTGRKRAPIVKGPRSALIKLEFSSPKELIEHLMVSVPEAVREHIEFINLTDKIKNDNNFFESLRSMTKENVTKHVSSLVLKAMLINRIKITETRDKIIKATAAYQKDHDTLKAKKRTPAEDRDFKLVKKVLRDLKEKKKDFNRAYADSSRGITAIGITTDDSDLIASVEDTRLDELNTPSDIPIIPPKQFDFDSFEAALMKYSNNNRTKFNKKHEKQVKALKDAKEAGNLELIESLGHDMMKNLKNFNSLITKNAPASHRPSEDAIKKLLYDAPVVKKEPEEESDVLKRVYDTIHEFDLTDDYDDYGWDESDVKQDKLLSKYGVAIAEPDFKPHDSDNEEEEFYEPQVKLEGSGAKYLKTRKTVKNTKSTVRQL